ncbi:Uncharacterized protein GBIM_12831, partial [Gryllus bimaculatus]
MMDVPEKNTSSSPSDDEDRWSSQEVQLGPGQVHPRGYRQPSGRHGELRLGLVMTKGHLELEVLAARNIVWEDRENPPGGRSSPLRPKFKAAPLGFAAADTYGCRSVCKFPC